MSTLKQKHLEAGIYSLADMGPDPHTGQTIPPKQRMKEIIQSAKMADEAGLEVFGLGKHHCLDYAVSSPVVVLAAIARETKNIRLTSTTSVLSTLDSVRLYEDFAALDLSSDGRAEILAGRGAFIDSFPLFGDPVRFKPLVDIYRRAGAEAGHAPETLNVGVTGHAYIRETAEQAKDEFYPYYAN